MNTILCVHQGTEKYGSDRSFVAAVDAIKRSGHAVPQVLLPGHGEIFDLLEKADIKSVETRHLWILRKAGLARAISLGLPANLAALRRAMADLRQHDVIYVNTAVILDFLLAAALTRRKITVHVREIPTGAAMRVIRQLLILTGANVIFNSKATRDAFDLPERVETSVVYNGFAAPALEDRGRRPGPLRVLCIGRLNAWKGQEVLVKACAELDADTASQIDVRIVGGVYKDQTHFRDRIETLIDENNLGARVSLHDFVDDPEEAFRDADVVVVPSTSPEPFGRVAIEAMAYGAAVIASGHGGLTEIVVDGETGRLVAPGDAGALADALATYVDDRDLAVGHGRAGRDRFMALFQQDKCDEALVAALDLEGASS